MLRVRWWLVPVIALSSCHGFKACDPVRPVENLPWKLWYCDRRQKSCIVFARFQSGIDCGIHQRWLHASCDPDAPPGEIHCRRADAPMHRKMYFSKCSTGNITFADVRDGGDWIE